MRSIYLPPTIENTKPRIKDVDGNYDIDGASQACDYTVVIASEEHPENKSKMSSVFHRLKRWIGETLKTG